MIFKGVASLMNNDVNVLVDVYNCFDLHIRRLNQNIGCMYLADKDGNKQKLPIDNRNKHILTLVDRTGRTVRPHNDELLYTFLDSYSVLLNGKIVLTLDLNRQHSIYTDINMVHEVIIQQ